MHQESYTKEEILGIATAPVFAVTAFLQRKKCDPGKGHVMTDFHWFKAVKITHRSKSGMM